MSKRNIVKVESDSKNPPALTAAQRRRLAALAARPDSKTDYSDIPKQTAAVQWSRFGGAARVRKSAPGRRMTLNLM